MKTWDEDLFDRRPLARDLISYCDSVAKNGMLIDGDRSIVVAVDADYGIGKTYFLRGLQLELGGKQPVAYIDAWSSDLLDDPLTAIASVLRKSVEPLIAQDDDVKKRWVEFASKTGKVMAIGGKGLLKRGAQLAITGGAVEGISEVWTGASEDELEDVREEIDKAVEDAIDDMDEELKALKSNKLVSTRIAEFEIGVAAIEDMKRSLTALVSSLGSEKEERVVYIIVDELDRCRPSYAIKFLEEIKHLFGVPGVVFILGVNSDQLGKAVSGIYGDQFDGEAYLKRFIDRKVVLPFPSLNALVSKLYGDLTGTERLKFPKMNDSSKKQMGPTDYLANLLEFHEISPRETFKFFDLLQTSMILIGDQDIEAIFLTEVICDHLTGLHDKVGRSWSFGYGNDFGQFNWIEADPAVATIKSIYGLGEREALKQAGQSEDPMYEYLSWFLGGPRVRSSPTSYRKLMNDVAAIAAQG
ncbi:KAP family P-loop NTPase fold protein [Qipengyuania vesicularis]|uniref:KAP family P-loop NTPase fold protein n=1 Tax=Qipengyuania vesicularis TaxID=2867232 RepID=UPI001C87C28E|nr:P-loop NTPase fold protein [Qipengyuania vesicularis]MBX7526566.1 KAP family NTPase [Qipengyuania vesicularis]